MGCNCKKNSNLANQKRAMLPRLPAKVFIVGTSQNDLPPRQSNAPVTPADAALTAERRRIEKLRRDAVRRSLGLG